MKTNYKKHALFGVVALLILLAIILPTSKVYATTSITIATNGELIDIPLDMGEPFIDKTSTTMIPIRAISEKLGHNVEWDAKTKMVKIDDMETVGVIVNSRAYVPLRFVSEALGHKVEFTHANKRADGRHYINIVANAGENLEKSENVPNTNLLGEITFTTKKPLKALEGLRFTASGGKHEVMVSILDGINEEITFELRAKGKWAVYNKCKMMGFDGKHFIVDNSKETSKIKLNKTKNPQVIARFTTWGDKLDINTLKPLPLPQKGDVLEFDIIATTKNDSAIYTVTFKY